MKSDEENSNTDLSKLSLSCIHYNRRLIFEKINKVSTKLFFLFELNRLSF